MRKTRGCLVAKDGERKSHFYCVRCFLASRSGVENERVCGIVRVTRDNDERPSFTPLSLLFFVVDEGARRRRGSLSLGVPPEIPGLRGSIRKFVEESRRKLVSGKEIVSFRFGLEEVLVDVVEVEEREIGDNEIGSAFCSFRGRLEGKSGNGHSESSESSGGDETWSLLIEVVSPLWRRSSQDSPLLVDRIESHGRLRRVVVDVRVDSGDGDDVDRFGNGSSDDDRVVGQRHDRRQIAQDQREVETVPFESIRIEGENGVQESLAIGSSLLVGTIAV